ncbi:MAG: TRAP transporter small permease subunit [Pseudomonadota bacterium]
MMVLNILFAINTTILRIGRALAWIALGIMVAVILIQVFFRYVPFLDALPWPEEAARFLMLWMTGLIAPSAYRWGGFVAIDMVPQALPKAICAVLMIVLLGLSTLVLIVAVQLGWQHTMGFGGNFDSSSLRLPLDWFGGTDTKIKLRYMYGSLLFCVVMMLVINIELIIRSVFALVSPDTELPDDDSATNMVRAD